MIRRLPIVDPGASVAFALFERDTAVSPRVFFYSLVSELSESLSQAMPIDVSSTLGFPEELLRQVEPFHASLRASECLEHFFTDRTIAGIIGDLDTHCVQHGVVGYHYTRSFAERIINDGLRLSTGTARRDDFLREFGGIFSEDELLTARSAYATYFDNRMNRARDNRVWFALTRDALQSGGADRHLRYYGGEVVYMPLTSISGIGQRLRSLGSPLVVTCSLHATALNSFVQYPFGKAWLSSLHSEINPEAHRLDFDLYSCKAIAPESILRAQPASECGWRA